MSKGVVANFVAFADRALKDFGMTLGVFADDKKGRVDVMSRENVEQLGS